MKILDDLLDRTKEGTWVKTKVKDFFSYPLCPHCRRWDMLYDSARIIWLIGMIIVGNHLINMTEGEIATGCCVAYKKIVTDLNGGVGYISGEDMESIKDSAKLFNQRNAQLKDVIYQGKVYTIENYNSTTTHQTTTTQVPQVCPEQVVCPEQKECPMVTCPPRFTPEELTWMLNYKPGQNAPSYQAGGFDCKDDFLNALKVDNRSRFRSRPSPKNDMAVYTGYKAETDKTYCFKDQGNYFLINRSQTQTGGGTQKMWGWNDEDCRKSVLRVNKL